ncbi:MAG: mannosyltransferase family protein [Meiothermus sp.]|nr:mannosyltransferase family protein [Meiothermus sp.]
MSPNPLIVGVRRFWAEWGPAAEVFLLTRLPLLGLAFLAEVAIPGREGPGFYHLAPGNIWLDVWARWDSGFYIEIARQGYSYYLGEPASVAFFPLYPLLIQLLGAAVGSPLLAGVLLSNLCFALALGVLWRLCVLELGRAAARRALFYLAAFPTAFFYSAVYTESLFLLLSLLVFYHARRGNWAWATLFCALASSSRIVGFLLVLVLVLEYLRVSPGVRGWPALLGMGLLGGSGLWSYMIFLWARFGDPLAFWTVQVSFNRENLGPLAAIWRDLRPLLEQNWLTGPVGWNVPLDLLAAGAGFALGVVAWRRLGASYGVYCILSLLIPLWSGTGSLSRYVVVLFPLFMILGLWGRRSSLDAALRIVLPLMMGLLLALFVNWYFVA